MKDLIGNNLDCKLIVTVYSSRLSRMDAKVL